MQPHLPLAVCLWAAGAAAAPISVPYSARVLGNDGAPLHGTFPVTVALYDALSGGNEVFAQAFTAVPVDGGYFTVLLTADTATGDPLDASLFSTGPRWAATTVGPETLSRQLVGVTPIAGVASQVPTSSAPATPCASGALAFDTDAGPVGSLVVCGTDATWAPVGSATTGPDGSAGNPAASCATLNTDHPTLPSATYYIDPPGAVGVFVAYCDMSTDLKGWTLVAQSRHNGTEPSGTAAMGSLDLNSTSVTNTAKLSDAAINAIAQEGRYLLVCDRDASGPALAVDRVLRIRTTRPWTSAESHGTNFIPSSLTETVFVLGSSETFSGTHWADGDNWVVDLGTYPSGSTGWTYFHKTAGPYCGGAHNSGVNVLKVFAR